jgi:hypothetical protein
MNGETKKEEEHGKYGTSKKRVRRMIGGGARRGEEGRGGARRGKRILVMNIPYKGQ